MNNKASSDSSEELYRLKTSPMVRINGPIYDYDFTDMIKKNKNSKTPEQPNLAKTRTIEPNLTLANRILDQRP